MELEGIFIIFNLHFTINCSSKNASDQQPLAYLVNLYDIKSNITGIKKYTSILQIVHNIHAPLLIKLSYLNKT